MNDTIDNLDNSSISSEGPGAEASETPFSEDLIERGFDPKSFSADDKDYVDQAKQMGWVEPERFNGDTKGYVGAKRFVERGRKTPSAVRAENESLSKELAEIRKLQSEMIETHRREKIETINRAYQQAFADIQSQMKKSVESGDVRSFEALREKEREILAEKAEIDAHNSSNVNAEFERWRAKNDWYEKDQAKTDLAHTIGQGLQAQGIQGAEFFDRLSALIGDSSAPVEPKSQPAQGGFTGAVGGAESPQSPISDGAAIPRGYEEGFQNFYDDFGPGGQEIYSSKDAAKKAFMKSLEGLK